ncbi:MAG TPA: type II 3-dehydroquinate dehydratase [Gaiellaceae bacterium]|jgi:3-dehydroquinate dehydratase-2
MRVYVLNGVNLNMLGRRDPEHYGALTLPELEGKIGEWADALGLEVVCRQTNAESEYVEWIQEALDSADAVIVNPAAWTHYSYAVRDALELLSIPIVEVHLSNIEAREEFRRVSVVRDVAALTVMGKGPEGYREALEFLARQ